MAILLCFLYFSFSFEVNTKICSLGTILRNHIHSSSNELRLPSDDKRGKRCSSYFKKVLLILENIFLNRLELLLKGT